MSRRSLLTLAASSVLAVGCVQAPKAKLETDAGFLPEKKEEPQPLVKTAKENKPGDKAAGLDYDIIYAALTDGGFDVPAVNHRAIDPQYLRQEVAYATTEPAYSIVVDTRERFLYWVLPNGRAIRYGVGLGTQGRSWKGRAVVQWKQKWPRWKAPDDMIARNPELKPYSVEAGGMAPGPKNPLGARAMYIFQNGKDTLYRIHGSPSWRTIGKNSSSGCVRMLMQDAIDLYDRVKGKTPLLVI
ncbi:L,D-transpeptidase [Rhizobium sp. RM]|uniref:L,D-transpeptidase n=1 Tax=Rhizobium sp. RM TaxID=2748079 RepID=UPI00110E2D11|nr:L,D-transpeptidase [Rhizobium sp. RM]NWJ23079.1 L,D-transpeptidase [Rhizobium sp. RM]TMV22015.1 L,D-transpeptidase [Rhizobium sp. Td3]